MVIIRILDSIKDGIEKGWEFIVFHYKWTFSFMMLTLIIPPIIRLFL